MDESKRPRDPATGELITQFEAKGPMPVPPMEIPPSPETREDQPPGAPLPRVDRTPSAPVVMRRSAVFVAHGMGQQLPFQTIDDLVYGLRLQDLQKRKSLGLSMGGVEDLPTLRPSTICHGDERLQRAELSICDDAGQEREVHVYEGYWAPLVEGKVTLRDVIGFLLRAGGNGIKNGSKPFQRWIFDGFRDFGAKGRTVRYLLVALAVVFSLVAMNSSILLLAAASSPMGSKPDWYTSALFADLSRAFDLVLAGLLVLAFLVALGMGLRQMEASLALRRRVAAAGWFGIWVAISTLVLGGLAMPLLFFLHRRNPAESSQERWLGHDLLTRFCAGLETALLVYLAVLLVWMIVKLLRALFPPRGRKDSPVSARRGAKKKDPRAGGRLLVGGTIGTAVVLVLALSASFTGGYGRVWNGLSFFLVVAVSVLLRSLLVQYPGDVAVYVSPHVLDRFNELRTEIRNCVHHQAKAMYAHKENGMWAYDRIYVVGHSLGSVIVYDTLNRLIAEDELIVKEVENGNGHALERHLDVLKRTRLLLTFGSPLDKTAFLFALQGDKTSEVREALASEVQPMIQHPGFRTFPWVNICSPEDIISGDLNFYDPSYNRYDSSKTSVLREHDKVQAWIEGHKGFPAKAQGADLQKNPYELIVGFPGNKGLQAISWPEFFDAFERGQLALIHPENASSQDTDHELVSRNRVVNERDEEATTVLLAHVEYWNNTKIFKELHRHLLAA